MEHRGGGYLAVDRTGKVAGSVALSIARSAGWALGDAWRTSALRRASAAALGWLRPVWRGSVPGRALGRRPALAALARGSLAVALVRPVGRPLSTLARWAGGSRVVLGAPLETALFGFALAFPVLPTSVDVVLVWGLAAVFALRRLATGRPLWEARAPYGWMLVFFAFAGVAALASVAPLASFVQLVVWASWLLLFWLAAEAAPAGKAPGLAARFALGAAFVALVAIAQWHAGIETRASWIDAQANPDIRTRVFSVFDDPNMLAAYFTCAAPLAAALALQRHARGLRALGILALALVLVADVFTFSRGGWIAVVVGLALVGGFWRPRLFPLVGGGLVGLIALAVALGPDFLRTRLLSLAGGGDSSIQYRISIWTGVLHMVRDNLWTGVGLGPGAFGAVYPHYMLAGTEAAHAHDIYLELLAELGLVGFLAFLAFALALVLGLLRGALARGAREDLRLVAAGSAAAVLALLLEGLTDNVWYSPRAAMALWLAAGLGFAARRDRSLPSAHRARDE